MSIEKFLDLSTAYMSENDSIRLRGMSIEVKIAAKRKTSIRPTPRIIAHEYGWWVNVQQDPDVFVDHVAALIDAGFTKAFLKVFDHARKQKCWWINFDQDGPKDLDGFRTFNW